MNPLRNPTLGLWAGNALVWLGLLVIVLSQLGAVIFGSGAALPDVKPLAPQTIRFPEPVPAIGNRNPFDRAAGRWSVGGEENAASGELRGIILLPGVSAAVTSSGTVHLGEPLAEGRLAEIQENKVIVEQGSGKREMPLPFANRPTLRSLGQSPAQQDNPSKGTQ